MLLVFAFAFITSAFAVPNIPWKFPADQRLIYQIDTSVLTSEYNVYVELNIPESAYSTLLQDINSESICWYLDHNAVHELWPRVYYFSDANLDQRGAPPYSVIDSYTYDVPQCGFGETISLPKTVRVYVAQLDTFSGDWNTIGQYLVLYFPGTVRMYSFIYSGDNLSYTESPWYATETWLLGPVDNGQYTPYGVIKFANTSTTSQILSVAANFVDVNIPLTGAKHFFVYAKCWWIDSWSPRGKFVFYLKGADGKIYRFGNSASVDPGLAYDVAVGADIPCNEYVDVATLLSKYTGKDLSFFTEIVSFAYTTYYGSQYCGGDYPNYFDDVLLVIK